MRDIIDVKGASGVVYRFTRFRDGNPLSAMGGNYIFASEGVAGPRVIYAGEAQNLLTDARLLWDRAVTDFGATDLFTRLNISERTRQQEQTDILATSPPPMNAAIADRAG